MSKDILEAPIKSKSVALNENKEKSLVVAQKPKYQTIMKRFRYTALIHVGLVSEVPKIFYYQAKNLKDLVVGRVKKTYENVVETTNFYGSELPLEVYDRYFRLPEEGLGSSDILKTSGKRLLSFHAKSSLSDGGCDGDLKLVGSDEEVFITVDMFENIEPTELLKMRYERSLDSFEPRENWPLLLSTVIAGLRGLLLYDVSLNTVRALTEFTNFLAPRTVSFTRIPLACDNVYESFISQGIQPIPRLYNVGPEGFDSHVRYSPPPPELFKPADVYLFAVKEDAYDEDFITGEWVSDLPLIAERKAELKRVYGETLITASEEWLNTLDLIKNTYSEWITELPKWEHDYLDELNGVKNQLRYYFSISKLDSLKRRLVEAKFRLESAIVSYKRNSKRFQPEVSSENVVLYFHGGGYCILDSKTHRSITSKIAKLTNSRVLAIDYRKVPEYRFPAALIDATSAYLHLIRPECIELPDELSWMSGIPNPSVLCGISPYLPVKHQNIFVMGDSAGGNLVMSFLLHLRDSGLPMPRGAVMISPWLDISCSLPSWNNSGRYDFVPRLDLRKTENIMSAMTGWDHSLLDHPLISPVVADLSYGLPPILLQVGECEYLRDDALFLYHKLESTNSLSCSRKTSPFRLEVYQDMVHVWHFFEIIQPAITAFDRIALFVKEQLQGDHFVSQAKAEDTALPVPSEEKNDVEFTSTHIENICSTEETGNQSKTVQKVFVTYSGNVLEIEGRLKLSAKFDMIPSTIRMK
ncbi:hypothetical protein MP638_002468 [Amoeboaphelidium occidentale]|nr:hypothetical protein MP638_002468 [Amoeboaphelidium occidentale]